MTSYGRAVVEKLPPKDIDHDAHGFHLIRQALSLAADTTMEGFADNGAGWCTIHQCKDIDAVRAWDANHAGFEWSYFLDAL